MIINCPECSTGFQLPDDRITPEGTKLKCSKCEHIFRVRDSGGEEPEIFYKNKDRQANATNALEQNESQNDDPFGSAGLDLEPGTSSAFGDLDEEDEAVSPFDVDSEVSELQEVAEEQEYQPTESADTVVQEMPPGQVDEEPDMKATIVDGEVQDEQEEPDQQTEPAHTESAKVEVDDTVAAQPQREPELEEDATVPLNTSSGGHFGDPEEHVDESFGQSGEYFDPDEGAVQPEDEPHHEESGAGSGPAGGAAGPKTTGGPPPGASGPPPTAASGPPPTADGQKAPAQQGTESPSPESEPSPSPSPAVDPALEAQPDLGWDEDELDPHNIGGNTGLKVVTVLLLLSVVTMGFFGVVAVQNDGLIDFQAFDDMLEVAFSDGEYEPREEWTDDSPTVQVVEPAEPLTVEGVHGQLVQLGGGDEIYVVQGMIRNHEDERIRDVELRASLRTIEGRTMTEVRERLAGDAPIQEFRELRDTEDIDGLLSGGDSSLQSGETRPFTLVFSEPPTRVLDGERYSLGVEVADSSFSDGSVAAQ